MRALLKTFVLGGFVALAIGCGDDAVSIETSAENVCEEIAEVACHNLYGCCTEGEIESFLGVDEPRSKDQCEVDVQRACVRATASVNDSVKAGRVRFDTAVMNACLNAIVAPDDTCAEVVPEVPWAESCMTSAWVGVVEPDAECFFSYECAGTPDAFCGPSQRCVERSDFGEPCGQGCKAAFFCSQDNLCAPRVPEGIGCLSNNECQKGLFCDQEAAVPVCTVPGEAGAACRTSSACKSGQCIPGMCSGTGQSCFEDEDCSGSCADDGSFCTNDGQCSVGQCETSGFTCFDPTDCGTGDTCVFPVQCIQADCIGDPVCTEPRIIIDYCEDAVSQLPGV